MLFKISLLTSLLFCALYPLTFWISAQDPLKNNFHRFHLGLPCVVLGVSALIFWFSPISNPDHKIRLACWFMALMLITSFYWTKPSVNPVILTVPSLAGIIIIFKILSLWTSLNLLNTPLTIISGAIFAIALYTMNLGHWYLNVPGLPLKHLKRAVYVFWGLSFLRMVMDIISLFFQSALTQWESHVLLEFMGTLSGFLLILAVLFGTVFPLICLYFVKGTLDVKSTQSATGILYAILCGVVIGEISSKYYLFKYGVTL